MRDISTDRMGGRSTEDSDWIGSIHSSQTVVSHCILYYRPKSENDPAKRSTERYTTGMGKEGDAIRGKGRSQGKYGCCVFEV